MNFKTNIIFRTLLIAVFFGGWATITEAQRSGGHARTEVTKICQIGVSLEPVDPIIPSICGDGPIQGNPQGYFSDAGEVIISVYAVNLEVRYDRTDVNITTYHLPEEADEIHLEYESAEGEYSQIGPITEWEYFGTYQKGDGPIYPMYRGIVLAEFTRPSNEGCRANNDPNVPNIHSYLFEMNVNLIQENGTLYPIDLYAGEDDIFSCKVFKENEFECNDLGDPIPPEYDLMVCIPCPTSEEMDPGGARQNPVASYSLTLSPNPFSDFIQYQYHSELDTEAVVSILSVSGQILRQEKKGFGIGKNTYLLDTNQLPQGVYFLQITDGVHREIQRMVKMD